LTYLTFVGTGQVIDLFISEGPPAFEANLTQLLTPLEEEEHGESVSTAAAETSTTTSTKASGSLHEDEEFDPKKIPTTVPADDDETTIADAERLLDMENSDELPVKEEIDILKRESELPLDQLLGKYKSNIMTDSAAIATDADDEYDEEGDESEEEEEQEEFMNITAGDGSDSNLNDKARLEAASAAAQAAQPTGFTLSTTKVRK